MDDDLTVDEIELAYLRALEVAEAAEAYFPTEEQQALAAEAKGHSLEADPLPTSPRTGSALPPEAAPVLRAPRLESWQVIEALLFVGGQPLTGRHLAELLGGSHTHEQVDDLIASLNHTYLSESRPYELQLGEGGYRMVLRPEFEAVRSRVYGQGPREVKLSQDAVELLAFVAYRQPVTRQEVDDTGKPNAHSLLRQLLRRELISLQREDDEESYVTTKRFLEVFGLASIDDLPHVMDFNFK